MSSVHCREDCLEAVKTPLHSQFPAATIRTSPELQVQAGASLKIQHEQMFSSNMTRKEIFS